MISTFDLKKLKEMFQDFHNLTGMRITIFDDSFHEIISCPEQIAPVCQFIRHNPEAEKTCHECDMRAFHVASSRKQTYIYRCHAGLTEAVAPVFVGGLPVAYVIFGHLLSYPTKDAAWEYIRKSCAKYDLDEEKLKELVYSLPLTPKDKILSSAHILSAVASYLCIEQMITLRQQTLPVRLDEYITSHLTENLDTATLCEHFQIGRTTLCETAKKSYGTGIAEHIRVLRIEKAKKLLREQPDLTILEIAEQCGFSDYNYFITVFRKMTGMPPGKYRNSVTADSIEPNRI